jgi:hypothetical protein
MPDDAKKEAVDAPEEMDGDAQNLEGGGPGQPKAKFYPQGWKLHTLTAG